MIITGGSVSTTVIVKEHALDAEAFPEASKAMQLTKVDPNGKVDPDGGKQKFVAPGQLSVTPTEKGTTAEHAPGSVGTTLEPGHDVITGGSTSLTVMMKVQEATPTLFDEVQRTGVTPFW